MHTQFDLILIMYCLIPKSLK